MLDLKVIVVASLWRQVIWVYKELRVFANDLVVLIRKHHLRVQIGFLLLFINLTTHVWRPKVGRSLSITTKSLLQLIWMEHVDHAVRGRAAVDHDFLECFFIYQLLYTFKEHSASPTDVDIV